MVRDVAVEEEVSGQLLAKTGSALGLQIERLRRSDHFDIDAIRLGTNDRILHRSVPRCRPQIHVIDRPRAPRPANGSTVRMVTVEYFRSAMDEAELRRIANVGPWDRRRRVAKCVRAVAHRLVFKTEILVLHVHIVNAERLAAVVDRAASWTIRVGQRIALRKEVALLVEGAERFVSDFMVEQHELAEIRTGAVLDHDLPTAGCRCRVPGSERFPIARPPGLDHEGAK